MAKISKDYNNRYWSTKRCTDKCIFASKKFKKQKSYLSLSGYPSDHIYIIVSIYTSIFLIAFILSNTGGWLYSIKTFILCGIRFDRLSTESFFSASIIACEFL